MQATRKHGHDTELAASTGQVAVDITLIFRYFHEIRRSDTERNAIDTSATFRTSHVLFDPTLDGFESGAHRPGRLALSEFVLYSGLEKET